MKKVYFPTICPSCKKLFNPKAKNRGVCTKTCSVKCAATMRLDKKMSKEHKAKIGLALKGGNSESFKKGMTPWNKGKAYLKLRGANNPNWKGGISKDREREMGRIEYQLWRIAVFERDLYTCQKCFAKGVYLHADHIKEWAKFSELRYEVFNGQTLCNKCHYFKTFGREIPENTQWGICSKRGAIQI